MFKGLRLSGIYQIRNVLNDKIYIGSAVNIDARWRVHKSELNLNKHHAKYLQHSYNKYGESNFKFEIILTCPKKDLIRIEQYCIDNYNPRYNTCKIAGSSLGFRHSAEVKRKISLLSKGHIVSENTKIKMSIANKGKKHPSFYKHVIQICPKTNCEINRFSSITQAAAQTNIKGGTICAVAKGRRKTAGKFIWKYV